MSVKIDKSQIKRNISIAFYQVRKYMNVATQPILSQETGIPQQQLSAYETGKAIPSLLSIIAIADALDVSIDYLVGRCDNRDAHKTTHKFKYRED